MKKTSAKTNPFILPTLIVGLVILTSVFQYKYDKLRKPFSLRLSATTEILLPAKILPYITFGFRNIITDYYWVSSIQSFITWNGKDPYYLDYFRNIVALDPHFEYPYLFTILAVPQNTNPLHKDIETLDKVAVIANKGIESIQKSWKIPFYLGTQYYLFTKTYTPAQEYIRIATTREGAPDGVYLLYSTFIAKNINNKEGVSKTSRDLVKVIYSNTDNETIKKLASKGVKIEFVNQMLEKGIIAYKTKYGHFPSTIEDLQKENLVSLPKELLSEFIITINKNTGTFKVEEVKSTNKPEK